jgi:hypothetical protein
MYSGGDGSQLRKHASLISRGEVRALKDVPFHAAGEAPLTRRLLVGDGIHAAVPKRIVAHELRHVSAEHRSYCEPHQHECVEINLLLSESSLTYEIRLGDELYLVEAPASIVIPAGLVHSANVVSGSGFFIALLESGTYAASAAADEQRARLRP